MFSPHWRVQGHLKTGPESMYETYLFLSMAFEQIIAKRVSKWTRLFRGIAPKIHLKSPLGPRDPSKALRDLKIEQMELKMEPLGLQIEALELKMEAVGLKNIKN